MHYGIHVNESIRTLIAGRLQVLGPEVSVLRILVFLEENWQTLS